MFPVAFGWLDMYVLMMLIGVVGVFALLEIYFRMNNGDKRLTTAWELNAIIAIMVGVVFAILFQNLYDFIENPSGYQWTWAMTFYGGFIGGVLSFFIGYFAFIRPKFGDCLKGVAIIAPACIGQAQAWGRIGCFLAGCCYGKETDSFLGVVFPGMTHKVWPTNLMEAVFLFLLSGVCFLLAIKKHWKYNLPLYFVCYGVFRFLIEFLRGDHRGSFLPGLTPSQFWSIVLVLVGIAHAVFLYVRVKKAPKES